MGFAKSFLFFFNFIYLGISAAIIFVAAWLIKKYGDITKITADTYTLVPCGILVGIGVLILITALFGCCGTCRDNTCCLSTFFLLLLIVFALEVTAGVLGYVYKDKARDFVNEGLVDAIKNYDDKQNSLDKAVDDFQRKLQCCGSEGPRDWSKYSEHHKLFYPKSCCGETVPCTHANAYNEGCLDKITDDVKDNLSYVLGTAIGLAVLQLLGMIGACYLMCCSHESGYLKLDGGIRV